MKVVQEDGTPAILQLPESTYKRIQKMAATIPSCTPFVNKLGQIIEPGDHVIAITTGYGHSVHEQIGRYVGQRTRKARYSGYGDSISTVIEYVSTETYWVDSAGKEYTSYWNRPKDTEERTRPVIRRRSLKRNRLYKIERSDALDQKFLDATP